MAREDDQRRAELLFQLRTYGNLMSWLRECRPGGKRGQCIEFSVDEAGSIGNCTIRPVDDFVREWSYAAPEICKLNRQSSYLGVVHADGAFAVLLPSVSDRGGRV